MMNKRLMDGAGTDGGVIFGHNGTIHTHERGSMASEKFRATRGIRFKFATLIGCLIIALALVDTAWNIKLQQSAMEDEALEKAQVLATEMRATWDFVDNNQQSINRNDDGTFRTKNLVCVVTAKAVSQLFMENSDYSIKFVKISPRQKSATPDEFELAAFAAFDADPDLTAYYGVVTLENGDQVFRYVEPLYSTITCLECHGDPVGQLDQFGYPKEGQQLGDVAGAMSITEPMSIYMDAIAASVLQQSFILLLMLVVASVAIYIAVSRLVLKPLDELRTAVHNIDEGDFSYTLSPEILEEDDEIAEFASDFNIMARRLEALVNDLEGEVAKKTDEMGVLNNMLMYQQAELKKYIDKLSEETAYKNEFFAITNHELRTPLTSILGYARMLRSSQGLDGKTAEGVAEIEKNATNLLDMVNNILVLSRAEAHKNTLVAEPIDFVDLLGTVKNSLQPLADEKDIELSARADENVPLSMADWEKLRRILENLTSNAIKYTHPGGVVSIQAHFEEEAAEGTPMVVLQVADNGIGIKPEDQAMVFQPYAQVDKQSAKRRYKGTGLGLAVVKELAELHGGSATVESEPKKGSVFSVRIPYVAVDEGEYDGE